MLFLNHPVPRLSLKGATIRNVTMDQIVVAVHAGLALGLVAMNGRGIGSLTGDRVEDMAAFAGGRIAPAKPIAGSESGVGEMQRIHRRIVVVWAEKLLYQVLGAYGVVPSSSEYALGHVTVRTGCPDTGRGAEVD